MPEIRLVKSDALDSMVSMGCEFPECWPTISQSATHGRREFHRVVYPAPEHAGRRRCSVEAVPRRCVAYRDAMVALNAGVVTAVFAPDADDVVVALDADAPPADASQDRLCGIVVPVHIEFVVFGLF